MPKPYDATTKWMLECSPADWLALTGRAAAMVVVVDADISTVSGAADKVLRLGSPPRKIMHLEFQARPDAGLPRRTHTTNALLGSRHGLPVVSVIVLLRREANLSNLTGVYEEREEEAEEPYLTFRYRIIRVWQLPVEQLLEGGLGTLALAPLADVTEAELPGVITRIAERVKGLPPSQRDELLMAAYTLMGLRYDEELINQLMRGVSGMEESVTYQYVIGQGRRQEARRALRLLGRERFGTAGEDVINALEGINDIERLERMLVRIVHASSWEDLLQTP